MSIKDVLGRALDLKLIESNFPLSTLQEMFPDATVVGFGWRNLTEEDDDNLGVRAKGTPDATDTLGFDLEENGWDVTKLPPVTDASSNELLDGRTRDKTMRFLNQSFMPELRIIPHESDTPNADRRAIALRLNGHSYAKRHDMFDFTASLVSDINDGECARNKNVMHSHLANNYDINNVFPVAGGTITKIVNNAYEMTDDTSAIVRNKERDDWIQWLPLQTAVDVRNGDIALLQVGGNRDEQLITRWIIPQGAKGKKARVILYVSTPFESKAKEQVKEFIKSVNAYYKAMYKCVSNSVDGVTITPQDDAFELVGIIPQIQNEHQMEKYNKKELITSVYEYVADTSYLSEVA
tara:strand:+ start:175 stop:1227 length:1053 start_codon:yes stop_codon:yes gene_type:complete